MGIMHKAAKYRVCGSVVLLVVQLCSTLTAGASADGCRRECGGMEIPYPFGLETDPNSCYRDESFGMTCNDSYSSPKLFTGNIEVISISLPTAKLRILVSMSYDCYPIEDYSTWNISLYYAYTFSDTDNVFTGVGCDTLAQIEGPNARSFTGGCLSMCDNSSTILDGQCSGIGCCQAAVPKGLQHYTSSFGDGHNHSRVLDFNPCSYSFLVEKGNYTFNISDLPSMDTNRVFPVVLDWVIDTASCQEAVKNRTSYACVSSNSMCLNSFNGPGYICNCSRGFEGNPYIPNGCQDIDECMDPDTYPCNGTCTNLPGTYNCTCPVGTIGDPKSGCRTVSISKSHAITSIVIGLSIGISSLILLILVALLHKRIKKRHMNKIKERFFHHNYEMLVVQQQLGSSNGNENLVNKINFFPLRDIEKATNNFDGSRIIGQGAHGTVYKGLLELRVVAIKNPKVTAQEEITSFLNEVILLSQINHRNVVQLIGCCLETEVPIIVYEFISNGTLYDHIHVWNQESPLSWDERLRIATEITSGISYLHTAANISVLHRDIKSSNILLDERLTAKVSDFGASKTIEVEKTHVSTNIQGTFGYLDPEYMHTGQLTDKSDVYSLGVILVELLTGQKPYSKIRSHEERNLISYFSWSLEENKLFDVVQKCILDNVDKVEVEVVARLAVHCLSMRGKDRPTMKDIEMTLECLMKGRKGQKINKGHFNVEKMNVLET